MKIKQLNIDCYDCRGPLDNSSELTDIIKRSAEAAGAKVLGTSVQNYPVHGLTAIVFLAESHVLISTYPEHRYAAVDIFMCNEQVSPEKCWEGIQTYLRPKAVRMNEWYHIVGELLPIEKIKYQE